MLVIGMGVGFGEVGLVVALDVLEIALWGKLIGETDVMWWVLVLEVDVLGEKIGGEMVGELEIIGVVMENELAGD